MDFGKFFREVSTGVRRSDERKEMDKTENYSRESPKSNKSVPLPSLTNERSRKVETTQDFKALMSQIDFGFNQKKPQHDSIDKSHYPSLEIPNTSKKSQGNLEITMNKEDQRTEKIEEKGPSIKVERPITVSNGQTAVPEPSQPVIRPLITIRTLLPMKVKRQNITEELDKKRQQELESKFLEVLEERHASKRSALIENQQIDESLADLDDEIIANQIGSGPKMVYKNGSFGDFCDSGFAPPKANNGFEAANSNPSFESSGGFFSAGGGKQIEINPDNLKAAFSLFGPDDEDNTPGKPDQTLNFSNPFQSANQGFGAASNPFAPVQQSTFSKFEEPQSNFARPPTLGTNTFSRFNEPTNGAISFTNGNMTAAVNISEENLRKAMAMMNDDSEEEKETPNSSLGFDENARMGPPITKPTNTAHQNGADLGSLKAKSDTNQGKPMINGKSLKPTTIATKPVSPQSEKANDDVGKLSLREHLEKANKDQQLLIAPKVKGNAFNYEPTKKAKFEAPIQTKANPMPKLNGAIKKPMVKLKTSLSKFYNKASIDNDRYTRITSNLKKKRKLQGYKEKRVSRNYGHHFLTKEEIYNHLKPELDELNVTDADDFLEQLTIELKYQLNTAEVDVGWVEHHLHMLSRKYYNRVKMNGASSSSCLSKNVTIIPYKVDLKNVLTDLYYRHRKENFFGMFSVLRNMIENTFQFDKRVCLMVTSITNPTKEKYTIELTDGWYLAYMELYSNQEKQLALLDSKECHQEFNNNLILRLILKKLLVPGQKIELSYLKVEKISENQPIYKPIKVEMFYNSVRRLPWDCQMGLLYTKIKPTKLKDIKPCGGIVPMIDVLIIEKRGIKISNHDRDEFMIRMQHSDNERLSINFSLMVVDSIHLDPSYTTPISIHMMTFRGVDPGKYLDINVGQRLQIYGVKMGKSKQYSVTQANFIHQMPWGLHFSENRRNSSTPLDVSIKWRNDTYNKLLDLRKKDFISLEEIKESLLKVMNLPKNDVGDFLVSAAVKFVKYTGSLCLFHLYEKHFIQVELRSGASTKPTNPKDEAKGEQPQMSFWERVMRDLTAISESNCELLLFYDLTYSNQSKVIELKTRGKIYIHKFTFDVINDYMLGENFIISNLENSSIERFLISEYKKSKNIKLGENDTIAQLICDMSKYPLT